jgi:hypothetical protein
MIINVIKNLVDWLGSHDSFQVKAWQSKNKYIFYSCGVADPKFNSFNMKWNHWSEITKKIFICLQPNITHILKRKIEVCPKWLNTCKYIKLKQLIQSVAQKEYAFSRKQRYWYMLQHVYLSASRKQQWNITYLPKIWWDAQMI